MTLVDNAKHAPKVVTKDKNLVTETVPSVDSAPDEKDTIIFGYDSSAFALITGRSSEIIGITFDDLPIDYPFITPYELSSLPIAYKSHKSNANIYAFYMTNYEITHFEGSPVGSYRMVVYYVHVTVQQIFLLLHRYWSCQFLRCNDYRPYQGGHRRLQ